MSEDTRIIPVILSGGAGTRLWPMSTQERPKQFLALTAEQSMFQLTAARTRDARRFAPPLVVASERHAALVEAQLSEISIEPAGLILEPCPRNTAPAIALAALGAGNAPLLVMPSDHVIKDNEAFCDAISAALPLLDDGWLVTFGITPDGPETGYGYIEAGEALNDAARRVTRFVEKPDRTRAEAMLAAGGHFWNGGIFLFRADMFLRALEAHAPAILDAARASIESAARIGQRILPDAGEFAASPSDSVDYAVMEKADRVAVVPVTMGWSDVGSWDALYALGTKDADGNCLKGDVRAHDATGNLVQSDGLKISISGIHDLIIVARGDEVMVLPRGASQDVKKFTR